MSLLNAYARGGDKFSLKNKEKPKDAMERIKAHREEIKSVLKICKADNCYEIHNIRKEIFDRTRLTCVYSVPIERLLTYIKTYLHYPAYNEEEEGK